MPAPRDVERYIKELEQRISLLERRQPLANSGMRVTAPGEVELTGNLTITGNLTAEGKISNDALTDPLKVFTRRAAASGFSLSNAFVEKAGVDVVVPAGFTQASAVVFGRMFSYNPNTTGGSGSGGDALYVRVRLASNTSTSTPTGISGNGGFATTTGFDSFDLTGLTPGSTVRLAVEAASGYQAIAADPGNYINCVASITWLR